MWWISRCTVSSWQPAEDPHESHGVEVGAAIAHGSIQGHSAAPWIHTRACAAGEELTFGPATKQRMHTKVARSTFAAVRTCKSTCAAAGRKRWHTTPTVTMADEAAADQTTIALRDRVRRAVYSISGISGDRVWSQPGAVLAYSPCATVPVRQRVLAREPLQRVC